MRKQKKIDKGEIWASPEGRIYTANNFDSAYLSRVITRGKAFLTGEIDPALGVLSNEDVNKVYVTEIDPKTAALGELKKVMIKELSKQDYIAIMYALSVYDDPELEDLLFIFKSTFNLEVSNTDYSPTKIAQMYNDIKDKLPIEEQLILGDELPKPIGDVGRPLRLVHIADNYNSIKSNLDKLTIINENWMDSLKTFPDGYFDYISLNNVLDYHQFDNPHEMDLKEIFELIYQKLTPNGTVFVTSVLYNDEIADENRELPPEKRSSAIECSITEDGRVEKEYKTFSFKKGIMGVPVLETVIPKGKHIYLDTILSEIGFKDSNLPIVFRSLSSDNSYHETITPVTPIDLAEFESYTKE